VPLDRKIRLIQETDGQPFGHAFCALEDASARIAQGPISTVLAGQRRGQSGCRSSRTGMGLGIRPMRRNAPRAQFRPATNSRTRDGDAPGTLSNWSSWTRASLSSTTPSHAATIGGKSGGRYGAFAGVSEGMTRSAIRGSCSVVGTGWRHHRRRSWKKPSMSTTSFRRHASR